MTTKLTSALPQESDAQEIGYKATKCFYANIPNTWRPQALDGDDDYGYDFQIQTVDKGLVKDIFRVQLKGKTSPKLIENGAKYSVSLDISTVNYYSQATEPILLVMSDLSVDSKPKNCNLYYEWIHEELIRIRSKGIPNKQKTVTFHVPVANRLDEDTDLTADIEQFRKLSKIGEQLNLAVKHNKPGLLPYELVNYTEKVVPGIQNRSPSLLDALTEDVDSSWIDAPKGTLPWHLQEARTALLTGERNHAKKELESAEKLLTKAKNIEIADYWHMVGRLHCFDLDYTESLAAFDKAAILTNDAERHLIPWAEIDLTLGFNIGSSDFSKTIARIQSNSPKATYMRARLMAAEGRFSDALLEAEKSSGIDQLTAYATIYTMQAKWEDALSICEKALNTSSLPESTKLLFYILKVRAKFSIATGYVKTSLPEERMPISGPAGTNPILIRQTWDDLSTTIMKLRKSGWPANVELIADIWTNSASILGLEKLTLPVLEEAADTRPTLQNIQAALESLAFRAEKFKVALKANERLTPDKNVLLRRVVLLHQSGRHRDCVELFEELKPLETCNQSILGFAYSMAILSADLIVRKDLVDTWLKEMAAREDLAAPLAVVEYIRTVDEKLLAKDIALDDLDKKYKQLKQPILIANQLFYDLDVTNNAQAKRCIELSKALELHHLLSIDEYLRLSQAYMTLERWEDLWGMVCKALTQFNNSDRLLAISAMALDKLGKTAEARDVLQDIINKPDPDNLALNTYINIASVSGFTSDAIKCIESVLEKATEKEKKIACLRHLFSLIHLNEPSNQRLVEIAKQIGSLADPLSETQEGLYLMCMFMATLPKNVHCKPEYITEFQIRLEEFTQKFPNSRILRQATFPKNASPEEMLSIIKGIAGIDEDRIRRLKKIQNELNRGLLQAPFAWRPQYILESIPDLPTLWEIAKTSRWTNRETLLTMVTNDWKPTPLAQMRGQTPLLDLTALLVINDLKLFDTLFQIFPRIAIGKATLVKLQELLSPMMASPFRKKCQYIREQLKQRFHKIEQPSADVSSQNSFLKNQLDTEEIIEIIKTKSFMLYSDDAVFRVYVNQPSSNPLPICTLDLLHAADEAGILSAKQVAECIARLCSWHVGVQVTLRYQIAILPDALGRTRDIPDGVNTLISDQLCNALYDGIWAYEKNFQEILKQASRLFYELVKTPENSIESITAVVGFWFNKVKFNPNAPSPPIKLLAQLVVNIAMITDLNAKAAQRLWSIYKSITEFEYGSRMDENLYKKSYEVIAMESLSADTSTNKQGTERMFKRLLKGLTNGTTDYDLFSNHYSRLLVQRHKNG